MEGMGFIVNQWHDTLENYLRYLIYALARIVTFD